ncbi:MAG: molecular chaperone DnaJ [Planctomycetota bacterium]|nr:molecular chaperone DnaJ [Planctomycetota bacterium]
MATPRDYYEVLGVARNAQPEEIKKAYKKLALANHPDRNPGDDDAIGRFKEASEAYEVLGDSEKRARYDRFGHAGVQGAGRGGGFSDVSDIFEAFGDVFGDLGGIFGGGSRRGGGRQSARQGDSLKVGLLITLEEAATGCTKEVEIRRRKLCSTCHGSGAAPGSVAESCDYCGGHGQVVQSQGFFRVQRTCPQCSGQGAVIRKKCKACRGTCKESATAQLDVRVPAGVDTGMRLCLRGEGEPSIEGGSAGDLYVEMAVKPHSIFRREGLDLICELPVSYTQATLGAEIEVPILQGRHQLTIPRGTQPGHVFQLRGMGIPDVNGRGQGDLLIQTSVEVPKKVTERQEELLREFAELEHAHVSPERKSFLDKIKDYFSGDD